MGRTTKRLVDTLIDGLGLAGGCAITLGQNVRAQSQVGSQPSR